MYITHFNLLVFTTLVLVNSVNFGTQLYPNFFHFLSTYPVCIESHGKKPLPLFGLASEVSWKFLLGHPNYRCSVKRKRFGS